MKPQSFRYREERAVATITLDRPEALNALTFEVYRELTDTLARLASRPEVRALVITGAGRAFCTGGDVKEIIGELLHRDEAGLREFTRLTCDLIRAMRALPRPIVASLNGTVAGAGAAIALASDLRIAADTARIAFLFVKVGLSGADMGAAHLLPRTVGLGHAAELLMTGEFIDAAEALRIGLYNRVVPRERLEAETTALAQTLARGPADGIAATKRALERELHMDLETALGEEAETQARLMRGRDFREGFDAFMAKRPPRFQGAPE
ncbi:MAG TPA: enoyl-CoA hydratase family protein [Vicinamibacteria bacterium]|nr:enoyl-CoA hydratase family protein [Vicinamibacteria bacterium]